MLLIKKGKEIPKVLAEIGSFSMQQLEFQQENLETFLSTFTFCQV